MFVFRNIVALLALCSRIPYIFVQDENLQPNFNMLGREHQNHFLKVSLMSCIREYIVMVMLKWHGA